MNLTNKQKLKAAQQLLGEVAADMNISRARTSCCGRMVIDNPIQSKLHEQLMKYSRNLEEILSFEDSRLDKGWRPPGET